MDGEPGHEAGEQAEPDDERHVTGYPAAQACWPERRRRSVWRFGVEITMPGLYGVLVGLGLGRVYRDGHQGSTADLFLTKESRVNRTQRSGVYRHSAVWHEAGRAHGNSGATEGYQGPGKGTGQETQTSGMTGNLGRRRLDRDGGITEAKRGRGLFPVTKFPVLANVFPPFGRDCELVEDGVDGAHRLTIGAVYARHRVDVIHLRFVGGDDTVHGTNFKTACVFNSYAGLGNHIGHAVATKKTANCPCWSGCEPRNQEEFVDLNFILK